MAVPDRVKNTMKRLGLRGVNKAKRTPNHPKKSHVVMATAGKPKKGESARMKAKRKSFKARHGKNIKKGKMSAAYWADKVKW